MVVNLRVYSVMLQVLGKLRAVLTQIERHDKDLGNQLRRAASSVALNIAEGSGSHGGTRLARYRTALGSARETGACLEVAVALGYVENVEEELHRQLDEVRAMLAGLVR
jgi:four helix bundle protein